jgi:hypothetical protein
MDFTSDFFFFDKSFYAAKAWYVGQADLKLVILLSLASRVLEFPGMGYNTPLLLNLFPLCRSQFFKLTMSQHRFSWESSNCLLLRDTASSWRQKGLLRKMEMPSVLHFTHSSLIYILVRIL